MSQLQTQTISSSNGIPRTDKSINLVAGKERTINDTSRRATLYRRLHKTGSGVRNEETRSCINETDSKTLVNPQSHTKIPGKNEELRAKFP